MYLIPAGLSANGCGGRGAGLMLIIAQPALFRNNFFLLWQHFTE